MSGKLRNCYAPNAIPSAFSSLGHPLDKYTKDLKRFAAATTQSVRDREHQDKVTLAGVVHTLKLKNSKKGDRYATFNLEDQIGVVEVIAWPETYRRNEEVIHADEPVVVEAAVDMRDDRCQLIANNVSSLSEVRRKTVKQVHFALRAERVDRASFLSLRETLSEHRGSCDTFLHLLLADRSEAVIALPSELKVSATEKMVEEVEQVLGRGVTTFQ